MKKILNTYQFEKISANMKKQFGSIKDGQEEHYFNILFPIEKALLTTNREYKINSGKKAIEAIRVCLLAIDGSFNNIEYNLEDFITQDNKPYIDSLLIAIGSDNINIIFDRSITTDYNIKIIVKCLLKIEKSIIRWSKRFGENGYFTFLETQIGIMV